MDQKASTRKQFTGSTASPAGASTAAPAAAVAAGTAASLRALYDRWPAPLRDLLAPAHLLAAPAPADLREMSKFTELTNLHGLAAHPIEHAAPAPLRERFAAAAWSAPWPLADTPSLSPSLATALRRLLTLEPTLVVSGRLAAASPYPFTVDLLVPQPLAHLALIALRLLAPPEHGLAPPCGHFTLLITPAPPTRSAAPALPQFFRWPASQGLAAGALSIACDDPCIIPSLLLASACPCWHAAGAHLAPNANASSAAPWFPELITHEGSAPIFVHPLVPASALGPAFFQAPPLDTISCGLAISPEGQLIPSPATAPIQL
jgi:hypothetical protein